MAPLGDGEAAAAGKEGQQEAVVFVVDVEDAFGAEGAVAVEQGDAGGVDR